VPGPAVAAVDLALDAADWRALGFTVDDDGGCRIGVTVVRLTGRAGTGEPLLTAWELREPGSAASGGAPAAIDGLPTRWTDAPAPASARHANTAAAVDHVVVRTPDTGRTFAALQDAGMQLRRERTAGTGSRALRQGFFRHGEAIVEVVGPMQAAGDGPAALWGVTVLVTDLDAAVALLGDRAGSVRDAVQPGRRIVTVRAEAGGGLPLAFMDA
jgi:hypothetical protein